MKANPQTRCFLVKSIKTGKPKDDDSGVRSEASVAYQATLRG